MMENPNSADRQTPSALQKNNLHNTEAMVYRQMDRFNGIQSRKPLFEATLQLLAELGGCFHADRLYFYQQMGQTKVKHVMYGWRDWERIDHNLREDDCAQLILECYGEKLSNEENVVICDVESLRTLHPSLHRLLCTHNVHSWVSVPYFSRGKLDGALSMVNPDTHEIDSVVFLMRSMSSLFSNHYHAMLDLEQMEHLATTDRLTGLDNRLCGGQKIEESLHRGEPGAFLLIDCDNFQYINEKFTHAVGDRLLVAVADVLRRQFPQGTLMRLGGDEFGLFLPFQLEDPALLNQWMYDFYYNINRLKVEGMGNYRVSFSMGGVAYQAGRFNTMGEIYQRARTLSDEAKQFEGNYTMHEYGGIPDLESAFYLLREDRHLYDNVNNDLFSVKDEESWLHYLNNSALLKSDMCSRNQRQYEQIVNFFESSMVLDDDYNHLYDLVLRFRNTLDAFMIEKLVGDILLPHYEKLFEEGSTRLPENVLRGHVAKLCLHLGDSLIGIYLMGDTSKAARIRQLFDRCIEVSTPLRPGDPAYEYQIYALCQLVGHYEFGENPLVTPSEADDYYRKLHHHLVGPWAVALRDPILLSYYTYLLRLARAYPLLRAGLLKMKGEHLTPEENQELSSKLQYLREHCSQDGVLDTCVGHDATRRLYSLIYNRLFDLKPASALMADCHDMLLELRDSPKAVYNSSDMMTYLILSLFGISVMRQSEFSDEYRRHLSLANWEIFLRIYKHRKSEASDQMSWHLACYRLSFLMHNKLLTPEEKCHYLIRTVGVLMIDTYSHSKAMASYASIVTDCIISQRPELLVNTLRNTGTVKQVKAHRRQILQFVETACMLHDIGKLRQVPIITNSYRKLSDHEFRILRTHPQEGRAMLSADPWFDQFVDIVAGHHTSYDGKGGYPIGYQYRLPNQRILVDIITVCDSLEAATSRIGRNYRRAKPFCQIMDEFYAESGTRYNPQVLDVIIQSRETYNHLKWMVDENWKENYRNIYQEIIVNEGSGANGLGRLAMTDEDYANAASRQMPHAQQTLSVEQLERIAHQQADHNQWLTRKLVENVESNHELNLITKGLHAIFLVMTLVKVKDGSMKCIQGPPEFLKMFGGEYHSGKEIIDFSAKNIMKPEWEDKLREFHDHTTLAARLEGRNSICVELDTRFQGWCRYSYCPVEYDETGKLDKVLLTGECINDEMLALQRLKFMAEYDGLTGLLSRYGGGRLINDMLANQTPGYFAVIDVDKFKSINDTYGHAAGDKVLATIGKILQRAPSQFIIIRQGGDEFVTFVKTDISIEEYRINSLRFFQNLTDIDIPELKGRKVTVSIGAVRYDGSFPVTFDELFRKADSLLYCSKRSAGNFLSVESY